MPSFAVLIYADESLHALEAADADLEENDQHAQDLQATGSMSLAYALTPRASAVSVRHNDTTAGPFVQADQFVAQCGAHLVQFVRQPDEFGDGRVAAERQCAVPAGLVEGGVRLGRHHRLGGHVEAVQRHGRRRAGIWKPCGDGVAVPEAVSPGR